MHLGFLFFLIQSFLIGIFLVHIHHSFMTGFDTLLLILDIVVLLLSLWYFIRRSYHSLLCFTIYLTFSIFVGLFEISLLLLENGHFILTMLCTIQFVLNIYLSFKLLSKNQDGSLEKTGDSSDPL